MFYGRVPDSCRGLGTSRGRDGGFSRLCLLARPAPASQGRKRAGAAAPAEGSRRPRSPARPLRPRQPSRPAVTQPPASPGASGRRGGWSFCPSEPQPLRQQQEGAQGKVVPAAGAAAPRAGLLPPRRAEGQRASDPEGRTSLSAAHRSSESPAQPRVCRQRKLLPVDRLLQDCEHPRCRRGEASVQTFGTQRGSRLQRPEQPLAAVNRCGHPQPRQLVRARCGDGRAALMPRTVPALGPFLDPQVDTAICGSAWHEGMGSRCGFIGSACWLYDRGQAVLHTFGAH